MTEHLAPKTAEVIWQVLYSQNDDQGIVAMRQKQQDAIDHHHQKKKTEKKMRSIDMKNWFDSSTSWYRVRVPLLMNKTIITIIPMTTITTMMMTMVIGNEWLRYIIDGISYQSVNGSLQAGTEGALSLSSGMFSKLDTSLASWGEKIVYKRNHQTEINHDGGADDDVEDVDDDDGYDDDDDGYDDDDDGYGGADDDSDDDSDDGDDDDDDDYGGAVQTMVMISWWR